MIEISEGSSFKSSPMFSHLFSLKSPLSDKLEVPEPFFKQTIGFSKKVTCIHSAACVTEFSKIKDKIKNTDRWIKNFMINCYKNIMKTLVGKF